jgi:flagellar biosynthesis component FlhA
VETGPRLDDDAEEAWRDAVWSALQPISDGPSAASVVTSPAIRSAVRTLLAPEFPELPVLSRTELVDGGPVEPAVTVDG